MKEIYVRDIESNAGHYIYRGYAAAWEFLGYKVNRWTNLTVDVMKDNILMVADSDLKLRKTYEMKKGLIEFLNLAKKVYLFVGPNNFPKPYGDHLNFVNYISRDYEVVEMINNLEHVHKWTFCDINKTFWDGWKNVRTIPLAYDSLSYKENEDPAWDYDVVYCGGWANNGFDTKKHIMREYFEEFKNSGLKCGFFINRNLSHEQECKLLTNAKVCINIHDTYQHELQLDTNERTFKSLGLGGILVSDYNGQIARMFGDNFLSTYFSSSPKNMVEITKDLIHNFKDSELDSLREENKNMILKNHTYIHRAKIMESL